MMPRRRGEKSPPSRPCHTPAVQALASAGAGFLLAVLWFDLMFDVQVARHGGGVVPDAVVGSIATYYRRVTTDARPMNRLVAFVMVVTVFAVVVEIVQSEGAPLARWFSLVFVVLPIGIAASRTVPAAVRLGSQRDTPEVQASMARAIYREHVFCVFSIAALLAIQLVWMR
jgi:ABC-type uncharacterized transport system permease subunit